MRLDRSDQTDRTDPSDPAICECCPKAQHMSVFDFTEDQIQRYSRHVLLPEVDVHGQEKLLKSSVLVIGAGGLGSAALLYLAAAGVGHIGVADRDCVELSNLQRQVLYSTRDVGRRKATAARRVLRSLNPDCRVTAYPGKLSAEKLTTVMRGYDLVLDCSDNFPTRFLVSDCAFFQHKPLVTAAVVRFDGQLMAVLPGDGNPCYRCFVPEPPPSTMTSCQQAGVLGAVPGVLGSLQAVETIKLIVGKGETMAHRLLLYDALSGTFRIVARKPNPHCPLCGSNPSITEPIEYKDKCCPGGQCFTDDECCADDECCS